MTSAVSVVNTGITRAEVHMGQESKIKLYLYGALYMANKIAQKKTIFSGIFVQSQYKKTTDVVICTEYLKRIVFIQRLWTSASLTEEKL